MRSFAFAVPIAVLLGACAGDQNLTKQSPQQPPRVAAGNESKVASRTIFARSRIYQITRLETAGQPRGEWRALGETIHQNGSTIEFTELGSGRVVSFTAPHQVTATSSINDRAETQFSSEMSGDQNGATPGAASLTNQRQ